MTIEHKTGLDVTGALQITPTETIEAIIDFVPLHFSENINNTQLET